MRALGADDGERNRVVNRRSKGEPRKRPLEIYIESLIELLGEILVKSLWNFLSAVGHWRWEQRRETDNCGPTLGQRDESWHLLVSSREDRRRLVVGHCKCGTPELTHLAVEQL